MAASRWPPGWASRRARPLITGLTFHDLIGTRFQQGVDTAALMQDVVLHNTVVTGPRHALTVIDIACRTALCSRGVAHLTVSKDVQGMHFSEDKASSENHGTRTLLAKHDGQVCVTNKGAFGNENNAPQWLSSQQAAHGNY